MNSNIIGSTVVAIKPSVSTLESVLPGASLDEVDDIANCNPSDEVEIPK